jgi:hypothetical protein
VLAVFFSCVTTEGAAKNESALSPAAEKLVKEAVFEVLVKQPARDAITYDKQPDYDLIPYAVRSDKYYSIGTAFAVSSTELVTAFHVINLGEASLVFDEYFIRDSEGKVFEVDSVIQGSREKDYLVFTVKGRTFPSFFQLEPDAPEGSQVFSIGNALGEGIIRRSGLVLGTVPENESGRWNQLKSSSDSSPGNSGGPLITPGGKVVSIITERRDNMLYSLPVSVMRQSPANKLEFRQKLTYGHLLLSNTYTTVFEMQVSLPKPYKAVREEITRTYKTAYARNMAALFGESPAYLTGPNNMHILSQVATTFPQLAFVDKSDSEWKLSGLRVNNYGLPDEGQLSLASVSDFYFIKVQKPKTSALSELNSDPKALMDLMLKGIVIERQLGSAKYRILSYGAPAEVSSYTDTIGRKWIKTYWVADYEDAAVIAYILPLPSGPFVVMSIRTSSDLSAYQWDIEAVCNLVQAPYRGEFGEWQEFLKTKTAVPPFLADLRFSFDAAQKKVTVVTGDFSVVAPDEAFGWQSTSSLFISPAYYMLDGKVKYGIKRLTLQRDKRGRDYVLLSREIEPDTRLGAELAEAWQDVIEQKPPFDNTPRISERDGAGAIGAVLARSSEKSCWWLYLASENPADTESLAARFDAMKNGISFK